LDLKKIGKYRGRRGVLDIKGKSGVAAEEKKGKRGEGRKSGEASVKRKVWFKMEKSSNYPANNIEGGCGGEEKEKRRKVI